MEGKTRLELTERRNERERGLGKASSNSLFGIIIENTNVGDPGRSIFYNAT